KKNALGVVDSVVAEDIAQFPEQNLADALQRIPGLTINRESGEGRQIQLRGLGPDFTQVLLNGMEALGTTSSAYDSRGSVSRSRGFDYNIFASELFSRVDVHKSYSANLDEGGLAGTVALYTPRPFDYSGHKGAFSLQAGDNSHTSSVDRRFAGLFSNTWGRFGALASVAYSRRDTADTGYDTVRWRQVNAQSADISALPASTQALISGKSLWFPRGARPIIFKNDIERLGVTLALQFKATDNLTLGLDLLYGQLHNNRDELHIQHATGTSTGMGCYSLVTGPATEKKCSSVTALEYDKNNKVTYYALKNTTVVSESAIEDADSNIHQAVFNFDWKLRDDLRLTGLIGHEDTHFIDNKSKVYMIATGDMTLDFRNGFSGRNTYAFDTTNSSLYRYSDLDIWQPELKNDFDTAKADLVYDFATGGKLSGGVSAKRYKNEYSVATANYAAALNAGTLSRTVYSDLTYVDRSHPDNVWLSTDIPGVFAKLGIARWLPTVANKNIVTEETKAAYAQYEMAPLDMPMGSLRGNAGLRYYDTKITSDGPVGVKQVSIQRSYSDVLPTLNLAWDVTPQAILRFSAAKNVSRVALGSLNVSGTIQNDASKGDLSISAGNPDLKPMTSTNLEVAAEYYFKGAGYVSLSVFNKDLKNLTGSSLVNVRFGDTGYPLSFLGTVDANGAPQTADTIYKFSMPININDATVTGYEIAFKRDFDFLPAPFNNLGAIVNYTHVTGDTLYENVAGTGKSQYKPFAGLSKHTANATLYYETEKWGARVSAAYRSKYILAVQSGNTDENERGFHESLFVDMTAFYAVTPRLKLTLNALNLTDEPYEQYSDSTDRLYSATTSGRTISLKAIYNF
ncbi:TonB-dependent receptor, partial [Caulobacter sp.]|uniref:TonB-dependent receptor n=1 Tax=Caulobacter sp. TaxID=78 RepID=UPI002B46DE70